MKKFVFVILVFILLAATAIPVLAKNDGNNGHENGNANNPGASATVAHGNGHGQEKDKSNHPNNSSMGAKIKTQQNTKWMFTPFYLQGTITAMDSGAHTITVNVVHANAKVKSYIGSDLTVVITGTTQIFQISQGGDISGTVGLSSSSPADEDNESENETDNNRVPITFDQLTVGDRVAIHGTLVDTAYTARLVTDYIGHPFNGGAGQPATPPLTQPITDNP
jgi:hypothetical protein